MLYKEITAIYCVNRAKHNKLCGQNKMYAFAKRTATIYFVIYVTGYHSTYFREIVSQLFLLKSADNYLFWLKSEKKNQTIYTKAHVY